MNLSNFNCFSGLAWTLQCPFSLEKRFGSCFLSRINPGSFTGHVAALSSARGEAQERDMGDSVQFQLLEKKTLFLKTICALALRDLGSHPLPQEISATSARRVLRERVWIWDGVREKMCIWDGIERESVDLGWHWGGNVDLGWCEWESVDLGWY